MFLPFLEHRITQQRYGFLQCAGVAAISAISVFMFCGSFFSSLIAFFRLLPNNTLSGKMTVH
jgi:hypothetical protein